MAETAYEPALTASYKTAGLDDDLFDVARPPVTDTTLETFSPMDILPLTGELKTLHGGFRSSLGRTGTLARPRRSHIRRRDHTRTRLLALTAHK